MKLLTKDILLAAKIASKSDIKPELASVYITPTKIVATDAFQLIEIDRSDAPDIKDYPGGDKAKLSEEGVMIKASELATLQFVKNKELEELNETALLVEGEDTVDISITNLDVKNTKTFRKVPGTYPKYQDLILKDEPTVSIKINPTMMIQMLQAYKKDISVTLEVRDELKSIVVHAGSKKSLLMPQNK